MSIGRSFMPFSVRSGTGSVSGQPVEEQTLFSSSDPITVIGFEPLYTIPAQWLQVVPSLLVTLLAASLAYYGCHTERECLGYFAVLYLRAILWVFIYVGHLFLKARHNRLKLLGYHNFLSLAHRHKKAPLQIVSFVNLLILAIHTILLQTLGSKFFLDCSTKDFSATLMLSIFCFVECVALCLVHTSYYAMVCVFNAMRKMPDALLTSEYRRTDPANEMSPDEFINYQFTMINNMAEENRRLRDKIQRARANYEVLNSESTQLSIAEQSLGGGVI